jgi:hypothetical protein
VQLGDAVAAGREAQRQRRHAEHGSPAVVGAAQLQEVVLPQAERVPVPRERVGDEVEGERVVAGGHRGVDREHRAGRDQLARLIERHALGHQLAAALERHERRVTLVHVPRGGRDAERAQHAHAGDAEDHLLGDAGALVAAVEARQQRAVVGVVLGQVDVEQQHRHAADPGAPGADHDVAPEHPQLHLDRHAGVVDTASSGWSSGLLRP